MPLCCDDFYRFAHNMTMAMTLLVPFVKLITIVEFVGTLMKQGDWIELAAAQSGLLREKSASFSPPFY